MQNILAASLSELPFAAGELIKATGHKKVVAFYGAMGAGKTTLIKEICKQLGVNENVSSPTFSLVNQYRGENEKIIYHFDFYRLKSEAEAFDFGYEEYFYSNNLCLIEWPEKIESLIPLDALRVKIDVKNETRIISLRTEKI